MDIWSAGCILVELILGKPLFTGKTEMDQLKLIFEMLGTPTADTWEGFQDLKLLRTGEVTIETRHEAKLRSKYRSKMSNMALNLVERLLELDPKKRLTANIALNNRYFKAEPVAPIHPEELGKLDGHFHERQTKKMRKEAKAVAEKAKQVALEGGLSEKEAQEQFDSTYKEIVSKVAKEGIQAVARTEKKKEFADKEERAHNEKTERKRDGDKESRKEKRSSREERRDDRRRDSRDKDKKKRRRDEGRSVKKAQNDSDHAASERGDEVPNGMPDRNGGNRSSHGRGRGRSRSRERSRDHRQRDEERRSFNDGKQRSRRRRDRSNSWEHRSARDMDWGQDRDRLRENDRGMERGQGRTYGNKEMRPPPSHWDGPPPRDYNNARGPPPNDYGRYGPQNGDNLDPLGGPGQPPEFFDDQRRRDRERGPNQRGRERY